MAQLAAWIRVLLHVNEYRDSSRNWQSATARARTNDLEMDVTPLVHFVQNNTTSPAMSIKTNVKQSDIDVAAIELRLYPKSRL